LQRLQEEVVDLEDMDTGINIMDLGLNEFRLDLLAYMQTHPDIEHTPWGMSAVVPASETAKPGVIYILKNRNNAVNIGHLEGADSMLPPWYGPHSDGRPGYSTVDAHDHCVGVRL
jgi:hypothetical protein